MHEAHTMALQACDEDPSEHASGYYMWLEVYIEQIKDQRREQREDERQEE